MTEKSKAPRTPRKKGQAPVRPVVPIDEATEMPEVGKRRAQEDKATLGEQVEQRREPSEPKSHLGD